ncbi:DUF6932 family protein [Spirosoma luteolum]
MINQYASLLRDLRQLGLVGAEQWINGRFVTRKPMPNELDLVTFIPFLQYNRVERELRGRFTAYAHLDACAVRVFPDDHPSHFQTN